MAMIAAALPVVMAAVLIQAATVGERIGRRNRCRRHQQRDQKPHFASPGIFVLRENREDSIRDARARSHFKETSLFWATQLTTQKPNGIDPRDSYKLG
ncbi:MULTISPECIES: hypothetical protein [Asticcacaulis]|uniref:hypothetical protein n=1 Tax=Asticcacaulis TaxID=76890 RepID=UPI001FD8A55D|nr:MULTISPECIES: hypothetical protein [Asticcacaulis]MBP2159586.1 hypothetical protein [Asticcacaulis solisilvae]MDR6800587.1 hypothetical protein [Asticcacaulis sp. BE141]